MEVVATSPHAWFLFKEADALFLDVECNHSAFGYSWMIELNEYEFERYASEGSSFLDQLAQSIQFSAPVVKDSKSPYKKRDVSKQHYDATMEAVRQWKSKQAQQGAAQNP